MIKKLYVLQIGQNYSKDGDIFHPTCTSKCPSYCTNAWKYANPFWLTNKTMGVSCGKNCFIFILASSYNFESHLNTTRVYNVINLSRALPGTQRNK